MLLGISAVGHPTWLFLSQKKYASQLLERAHMVNCNPSRTPIDTDSKLGPDGVSVQDPTLYCSLAGGLQYLTFTCPDLSYAVQQIWHPLEFGLQLYISVTTSLVRYTDADWAGCPSTRRSTSGYCVFLGDNLLSWSAKRQHTISRSSAEAEYRGVANVVAETAWIRNLLRELHSPLLTATLVYCDNVSVIYMSDKPVQHQRTKHIEIDIHFVRDMVKAGHVRVLHVPSRFQYADIFTKGLPSALFEDFRSSLSAAYVLAFNEALIIEERFLKQKAKIEWLRVGDSNSAYIHKDVKGRVSRSRINVVSDSNGILFEVDQVPMAFVNHYVAFLGQQGVTSNLNTHNLFTKKLYSNVAFEMIKTVTNQEVKDAIFSMGNDKSPDPDGYMTAFFKEAWDIVANDVTRVLQRQVRRDDSVTYHRVIYAGALDEFKLASGLTPSLPKSTAYFCNVLNYTKLSIFNILPFEEGHLSVKYLGVPLISSRLIYRDCMELIEKVQNHINDWKNKSLSAAGRLQLVQSVIGSMHVYWAFVFTLPFSVLLDIEQLMRGFLWCQRDMRRGKAKVAWEVVYLPKKEAGIGLCRLDIFNKALMVSHIWSLLSLKESLWVKWIHAYKLKGQIFWDVPIRGNMAWEWRKVLQIRPIIREFIWYIIGDGSKVFVWFDHWCPISPLSKIVSAHDIHRAGFDMSTMIKDLFNNGQWTWPHDWISKYPVLATIVVPNIISNVVDELEWRDSFGTAMDFSVSSIWECIRPRGDEITWCDVVWFLNCIPRHAFHLWLVIKRKLMTQDNLRQWDVSSNTNLNLFHCPLCESQPDSHDHLFFEYVFSLQVWNHMKIYVGTPRVAASLNAVIDHIIPMSKKKTTRSVIAKLVFVTSTYFVWQERNYRLFKNRKRSPNQIIDCIKITVRLKLLTCRFKKTKTKMSFMHLWKLHDSLIYHDPNG
ncbi:hypothetical protein Tco_0666739 [Tanacetum coccineum]